MLIFKCKMCGGDVQSADGAAFGTCDSCGVTSTLPKANDEKLVNLFNRANHFRRLNEFDKALAAYESILNEDSSNAEAHWCAVLCRYGIEYVEDPRTHERVPTCHRAQYSSILADADYLAALENSPDSYTCNLYETEAKKISEIQKGILAISNREEPFDVFICYKETTDGGSRTKDSAIAQDIYYQLTKDGYRVFFSKITLEDKLGQEYEPYIFAALNSAKVMLVVGTTPEHFNAVWVKNEWSRFLALTKIDRSRLLIPCYRDMDAYDLPEELSMLQSQDMSKIGFLQDIIRGIKKVLDAGEKNAAQSAAATASTNAAAQIPPEVEKLIKRGNMYLEDENWEKALSCFCEALDMDEDNQNPDIDELDAIGYECAPAYIGKMCAECKMHPEEMDKEMEQRKDLLSDKSNFLEVFRYFRMIEGMLMLQERDFETADKIYNAALDIDPEYAPAYEGRLLAELRINSRQALAGETLETTLTCLPLIRDIPLSDSKNYQRIMRFGDESLRAFWEDIDDIYTKHLAAREKHEQETRAEAERSERERLAKFKNQLQETAMLQGRISAGVDTTAIVNPDGTVDFTGYYSKYSFVTLDWVNVAMVVSAEGHDFVALKKDGTVYATALVGNRFVQDYVSDWKDIVTITTSGKEIYGIQSNGSVLCYKSLDFSGKTEMLQMKDVVQAAFESLCSYYLKKDGTVVATGYDSEKRDVSAWRDIIAISCGASHAAGLKKDGTVVAVGSNGYGVERWNNIIAVSTGGSHTVGLKADGTVVVSGSLSGKNPDGSPFTIDVSDWRDIVAVSAGVTHIVGMKSDGTLIATGSNCWGKCNVSKEQLKQQRQGRYWERQGLCKHCGGVRKGLMMKKCTVCGKSNSADIA